MHGKRRGSIDGELRPFVRWMFRLSIVWLPLGGISGLAYVGEPGHLNITGELICVPVLAPLMLVLSKVMSPKSNMRYELLCMGAGCYLFGVFSIAALYRQYGYIDQVAQSNVERHDLFDALYLALMTITTVGFGDVVPAQGSRWVAILGSIYGYLGTGLATAFIVSLLTLDRLGD